MSNVINTREMIEKFEAGIVIPKLQRSYVWTENQWNELWKDIRECYKNINSEDKNPQHLWEQ